MVIVSDRLIDALRPSDLDHIVMHEHAHLARYDDWLQLLQAGIEAIAGLHPAVAFIGRRIEVEREAACDDRVVMQTGAAWQYARSLSDAAEIASGSPRRFAHTVAPGATRSARVLVARVARLVDRDSSGGPRQTRLANLLGGLSAAVAACLAVVAMPQLVVEPQASVWPSVESARAFDALIADRSPFALVGIPPDEPSRAPASPRGTARRTRLTLVARGAQPQPIDDDDGETGGTAHHTSGKTLVASWSADALVSSGSASELHAAATLPARSFAVTAGLTMSGLAADRFAISTFEEMPRTTRVEGESGRWSAVGDRSAELGRDIGRASARTGAAARGAGVAVANFFGRAGKVVAERLSTDP